MTAGAAIVGVVGLTLLGGLSYAGVLPESLRSSPEEFLASLGLDPDDPEGENGDEENGFDPAPLREGSEASENASETAISVLTVIQAWHDGEFESGCEFGQAVAAAARGDAENGENGEDAFNPCEKGGENGEEASAAGRAKGEEMSEAGKAKGEEASAAGKAKGEAAAAAGKAKGEGASGGAGSGGGPPAGAGPPSSTPGGP